jgi:hypothetical protein
MSVAEKVAGTKAGSGSVNPIDHEGHEVTRRKGLREVLALKHRAS